MALHPRWHSIWGTILGVCVCVCALKSQSTLSAPCKRRGSFATRLRTTASVMSGTEKLSVTDPQTNDAVQV